VVQSGSGKYLEHLALEIKIPSGFFVVCLQDRMTPKDMPPKKPLYLSPSSSSFPFSVNSSVSFLLFFFYSLIFFPFCSTSLSICPSVPSFSNKPLLMVLALNEFPSM
jgi:hypothetical protein